jgi:hypothetical protein
MAITYIISISSVPAASVSSMNRHVSHDVPPPPVPSYPPGLTLLGLYTWKAGLAGTDLGVRRPPSWLPFGSYLYCLLSARNRVA